MKKILLALGVAALTVSSAFAQGTVYTLNTGELISTNNGTVSGVTQGNGFYYALLIDSSAPTSSNPMTGGWTFSGVTTTNLANGLENGGSSVTVNGWPVNTTVYYELVGWSVNSLYYTYTQVLALLKDGTTGAGLATGTYYGVSSIGSGQPGGGTPALAVYHLFGSSTTAQGTPITGFTLNVVPVSTPEPTTLALGALGGAAMLLIRRKK